MDVKPIKTDLEHARAVAEIEKLWDAKPGTPEHDRLDALATLVDAYEEEHHSIPPPDPAFVKDLERRIREAESGDVAAIPLSEIKERIASRRRDR